MQMLNVRLKYSNPIVCRRGVKECRLDRTAPRNAQDGVKVSQLIEMLRQRHLHQGLS